MTGLLFSADHMPNWPFKELEPHAYDLIMIDWPWLFENWSEKGEAKNAKAKYPCLHIDEYERFPIKMLAKPDCLLWMWAVNPMLDQALELLRRFGFRFSTAGTWVKKTKNDKDAFGQGYVFRTSNEPILIGKIGSPKVIDRSIRSVIYGPVREHSRKPDQAYEVCERMNPAFRRCDVFSRQRRAGWECFGNEVQKFPEAA